MEWWFGKTKYCMTDDYSKDAAAAGTFSSSCREAAAMESEIMFTEEIVASTYSCSEVARVKNELENEVTSSNIEAVAEVKSVEMLKTEIAEGTTSSHVPEESEPVMMFNSSMKDAEPGEGSSQTNFCRICMEEKEREEMFINGKCPHAFCIYCMSQHIASKIEEDQVVMVMCPEPNCRATLEPHICKGIIHEHLFDKWCTALCKSLFPGSQRLYCPFKDCSAMLVLDNEGEDPEVIIREAECLHCQRLFCAVCAVPWHAEIHCDEFQRLNKDEREVADLMLINLAKTREWKRCPSCKYYVEKTDGCLHITCRCTYELCYRCGGQWNDEDHDVCS